MKIGMRTIKTAVCATLGMILAQQLGLLYPTSAGIIAILSVTNTKRSAFRVGFYRLCSLGLATAIAFAAFQLIGYNALAFGVYLLFFIPLAVRWNLTEGIPVSSVLVTHFLLEETMALPLILNAFYLLTIGVGLALLANLYMPDKTKRLAENQQILEAKIRELLVNMSLFFDGSVTTKACQAQLHQLSQLLAQAEHVAQRHDENQLLSDDHYYFEYFTMRRLQLDSLEEMTRLIVAIDGTNSDTDEVARLFAHAGETFSAANDGRELKGEIQAANRHYQEAQLPQTRLEFENRARLYQLLNEFERFIDIKIKFSQRLSPDGLDY